MFGLEVDFWFIACAAGALGLAAFVQGFIGFGAGITAVTLLALASTVLEATAITNLCAVVLTGGIFWQLRGHVRWRMVWPLLIGQAVGLPIGVLFLSAIEDEPARRVMGVFITCFAVWLLLNRSTQARGTIHTSAAGAIGLASGMMSGAFCMGGPPLIAYIYTRRLERDALKGTIQVCFVFNTIVRLAIITGVGHVTAPVLVISALVIPVVILAMAAGLILAGRVETDRFRPLAWTVFAAMGILLLVR